MSLSALLEQQRRELLRARSTSPPASSTAGGSHGRNVIFRRGYLTSVHGGSRPQNNTHATTPLPGAAAELPTLRHQTGRSGSLGSDVPPAIRTASSPASTPGFRPIASSPVHPRGAGTNGSAGKLSPLPKRSASHLTDALNLTVSILERMHVAGDTLSEGDKRRITRIAELSAMFATTVAAASDSKESSPKEAPPDGAFHHAAAAAPPQPTTPTSAGKGGGGGSLAPRRNSRDLFQKLRGVAHSPQLYRDMVSSKAHMKGLAKFSLDCAAHTTDIVALYKCVRQQFLDCFDGDRASSAGGASEDPASSSSGQQAPTESTPVTLDLYVVDTAGRTKDVIPLVNIEAQSSRMAAATNYLVRDVPLATQQQNPRLAADGMVVPITAEGELYGVAHLRQVSARQLSDNRLQLLSATAGVSALSLRTAAQFERLDRQRNKSEKMLELVRNIAAATSSEAQIVETIMVSAKELVDAAHCNFHYVEDGQIVQPPGMMDFADNSQYSEDFVKASFVLEATPEAQTIANEVARRGSTFVRNDMASEPERKGSQTPTAAATPKNLDASSRRGEFEKLIGMKAHNLLCLPVKDIHGHIIGVAQLYNKEPRAFGGVSVPQLFGTQDEMLFKTYASFAAISIRNCRAQELVVREKSKSDAVLHVVRMLADTDIRDVNSVVSQVMLGAKNLLHADRSSLFLIDEERNELYSQVADNTGGREIRFPIGKGIAGTVASTGIAELIDECYSDERFNHDIDKQLGYRTRTMLAEPIAFQGDILAVAQLVNKLDPASGRVLCFTKEDQETFRTFALFAGISLKNSRLLEFVIRAGDEAFALNNFEATPKLNRRSSTFRAINVTDRDRADVMDARIPQAQYDLIATPDFDLFAVRDGLELREAKNQGSRVVYELFMKSGFVKEFDVDEDVLLNFILRCRHKYRSVPYHNFFHAVDTVQTIYTFLFKGGGRDLLTGLEAFTLMIAALCHDLDHMGLNNNYHLRADSPLGMLSSASGSKSVLEVHHCNLAIEILQEPTSDLFAALSKDDRAQAYRNLIDVILATDMARHTDLMQDFQTVCDDGLSKDIPAHRTLAMQMMLKAADISNVTKPFEVSRLWALSVTEEFYQQGDTERKEGMAVNPMFDRNAGTELAKGQLGFIGFIARRFFEEISAPEALPGMQWCATTLASNEEKWQHILEEQSRPTTAGTPHNGVAVKY